LVLKVKGYLELLAKASLCKLLDLRRRGNFDVLDFVVNDEVREVHVDLRDDALRLEVVDTEPEVLSAEVLIPIFGALAEEDGSLHTVIVLESDSFVDKPPGPVLLNHFFLSICGYRVPNLELE
jgi:hypothetical protein